MLNMKGRSPEGRRDEAGQGGRSLVVGAWNARTHIPGQDLAPPPPWAVSLGLVFGWGGSAISSPHCSPSPETITSLYKTSFRVDVPFDLPEIFFFVALG